MTLAIAFAPEAFDTKRHAVLGRRVANRGFLAAHMRTTPAQELFCYAAGEADLIGFQALAQEVTGRPAGRLLPRSDPAHLADVGCLYWPSPAFVGEAWRRDAVDARGWSIIGTCHSLASAGILHELAAMATAPVREFDALVCSSRAAKAVVERVFEAEEARLRRDVGASCFVRPQLPVIPLGVDLAEFSFTQDRRRYCRAKLDLAENEVCVLHVGRLDRRTKAHPLPWLLAIGEASRQVPRLTLLLAGQFTDDEDAAAFSSILQRFCPGLILRRIDANRSAVLEAYAAADLFVSLVDNVQESFGLAPLEAMASGLPCVVSDWDGYRDVVRDGIDGFLIPTLAPPATLGTRLADLYHAGLVTYEEYGFQAATRTVVDVPSATAALARLATNRELRQRMGAEARRRAASDFDWLKIVADYHSLAADLKARRFASGDLAQMSAADRLSPFDLFQGHASHIITTRTKIYRSDISRLSLLMAESSSQAAFHREMIVSIMAVIMRERIATVGDLIRVLHPADTGHVTVCVLWLGKFGVLRLAGP